MYNPEIHHRKSIRLKEYDYSQEGYYFITICTKNREQILSKIQMNHNANKPNKTQNKFQKNVGAHICAQIKLTKIGIIIEDCLYKLEKMYSYVKLHDYVIMPNHIHVIIEIDDSYRAQICAPTTNKTIGQIIRGLKAGVSKEIGYSIWQRNYYEHIIRNEKELYAIKEYIQYNPMNWDKDYLNK